MHTLPVFRHIIYISAQLTATNPYLTENVFIYDQPYFGAIITQSPYFETKTENVKRYFPTITGYQNSVYK